ncbi:MAG TPA: hypothetical protein VGK10_16050 [Prolixibacteraceae bacterium]
MKTNPIKKETPVTQKPIQHQLIFKIISICLPILVLVFLELGLRLFHYGYSTTLFVKDKVLTGYYTMNPDVTNRFFNLPLHLSVFQEPFKKEKPANTYRVFVLGESTTIGFPYFPNGSFHRMLLYRLNRAFPDKKIELINLSITAVNSYSLLSFTNEVNEMNPDAVMIYVGHNEYYGALGVASNQGLGLSRSIIESSIYLKRFRVVQLAFNFTRKFKSIFSPADTQENKALMQIMAEKQEVVYGSKIFRLGLQQFELNMDEMLNKFNQHHVPVYLSNVVSNEKGQKPFISKLKVATDTTNFMAEYNSALDAFNKNDFEVALAKLLIANKIDTSYAMNNFLLGEVFYAKNDFINAHRYYSNAKELDALRFRAPDAINVIIDKLCKKYNNIHFVDSKKKFMASSDHGILDNKLFVEHLHPTLPGYFLLSDAFYDVLLKTKLFGNCDKIVPADSIKMELPITSIDTLMGTYNILDLRSKWPFYENMVYKSTNPYVENFIESQLTWEESMNRLYSYYSGKGNNHEALRALKGLCLELPFVWKYPNSAGRLCFALKDYNESLFYFKLAYDYKKDLSIAKNIALVLAKLDRLEESKQYLTSIKTENPSDESSDRLIKSIDKIVQLKPKVISDPNNIKNLNLLTSYYIHIGNYTLAMLYNDKSRAINAKDADANMLLSKLKIKLIKEEKALNSNIEANQISTDNNEE